MTTANREITYVDVEEARRALLNGQEAVQNDVMWLMKGMFDPSETFVIPSYHSGNITPIKVHGQSNPPAVKGRAYVVILGLYGSAPVTFGVIVKKQESITLSGNGFTLAAPLGNQPQLLAYDDVAVPELFHKVSKQPQLEDDFWNGTPMMSICTVYSRESSVTRIVTQGRVTAGLITDARDAKGFDPVLLMSNTNTKNSLTGSVFDGVTMMQGPQWCGLKPVDMSLVAGAGEAARLSLVDSGRLENAIPFTNHRSVCGLLQPVSPQAQDPLFFISGTQAIDVSRVAQLYAGGIWISDSFSLNVGAPTLKQVRLPAMSLDTYPSLVVRCRVPVNFANLFCASSGTGDRVRGIGTTNFCVTYTHIYLQAQIVTSTGVPTCEFVTNAVSGTVAIPLCDADFKTTKTAIPTGMWASNAFDGPWSVQSPFVGGTTEVEVTIPSRVMNGWLYAGTLVQGVDSSENSMNNVSTPGAPTGVDITNYAGTPLFIINVGMGTALPPFGCLSPWFAQADQTLRAQFEPQIIDVLVYADRQYDTQRNQVTAARVYDLGPDQFLNIEYVAVVGVVPNTGVSAYVHGGSSLANHNILSGTAVGCVQALFRAADTRFGHVYPSGKSTMTNEDVSGPNGSGRRPTFETIKSAIMGLNSAEELLHLADLRRLSVFPTLQSGGFFGNIGDWLGNAANTALNTVGGLAQKAIPMIADNLPAIIEGASKVAPLFATGEWGAGEPQSSGEWGAGQSNGGYTCSDVAKAPGEVDEELATGGMWGAGEDDGSDDDEPSARAAFGATMLGGGRFKLRGKGGNQAGFWPGCFFSQLQLINLFDRWWRSGVISAPVALVREPKVPFLVLPNSSISATFAEAYVHYAKMENAIHAKGAWARGIVARKAASPPTGNETVLNIVTPNDFQDVMTKGQGSIYFGTDKAQEMALDVAARIFAGRYTGETAYFEGALSNPAFKISGNILSRTKTLSCTVFFVTAPVCLLPYLYPTQQNPTGMPILRVPLVVDATYARGYLESKYHYEHAKADAARLASARNPRAFNRWAHGGTGVQPRPPGNLTDEQWEQVLATKRANVRKNAALVRPRGGGGGGNAVVKTELNQL